jgi:folate-binding protein YgfZ
LTVQASSARYDPRMTPPQVRSLDTAALFDDSGRAAIRLSGADRVKYAQSMLTNDVKVLGPGQGCLACALTAKGKLVALARVEVEPDAILLDTDLVRAAALRDHLRRFIVINKVVIEDAPQAVELAVEGPRAGEAIDRAIGNGAASANALPPFGWRAASIAGAPVRVTRFSTAGPLGFRARTRPEDADRVRAALAAGVAAVGGDEAAPAEVERARILRGWPRWGHELDESTLPPQAGLTEATISYTKGCYLGQEPIAMLKFRGQLNRRLCRLGWAADVEPPPPRAPLFAAEGGRPLELSQLTSVAPALPGAPGAALAYLQREAFEPGTRLRIGSPSGPEAVAEALAPLAWG